MANTSRTQGVGQSTFKRTQRISVYCNPSLPLSASLLEKVVDTGSVGGRKESVQHMYLIQRVFSTCSSDREEKQILGA